MWDGIKAVSSYLVDKNHDAAIQQRVRRREKQNKLLTISEEKKPKQVTLEQIK